jgi:hypothetical protein
MIDDFQFDDRAKKLYDSQRVIAKRDNQRLPFTRDEFTLWLWRAMGGGSGPSADALKAQMCAYGCNRPVDILSISIDHRVPRAQGGSYALENLLPCCKDCNILKGNMTEAGFRMLMEIGRQMGARDWQCIQESIRNGAHAKHDRWRRLKAEKALEKTGKPAPAYRGPGTLDFDNDPSF